MGFDLRIFDSDSLSETFVEWLVDEQSSDIVNHFGRLWDYYQNQMQELNELAVEKNSSGRDYVQTQERGLPSRITGMEHSYSGGVLTGRSVKNIQRKEVVIENDISWRINAMVDFLFGKGVSLVSKAPEVEKRREIEKILKAVFSANGDVGFFQDMAVLGSVYGFVDCVVRPGQEVLHQILPTNGKIQSRALWNYSYLLFKELC